MQKLNDKGLLSFIFSEMSKIKILLMLLVIMQIRMLMIKIYTRHIEGGLSSALMKDSRASV